MPSNEESDRERGLRETVRRMRDAQRRYFKTRDRAALSEAQRLEREVDAALDDAERLPGMGEAESAR